jgi:hypothetical protein
MAVPYLVNTIPGPSAARLCCLTQAIGGGFGSTAGSGWLRVELRQHGFQGADAAAERVAVDCDRGAQEVASGLSPRYSSNSRRRFGSAAAWGC